MGQGTDEPKVNAGGAAVTDTRGYSTVASNSDAFDPPHPNYLICDRSGFKVRVDEGLKTEWNGLMVREADWEPRHPQDLIRPPREHSRPSPRPEQSDSFTDASASAPVLSGLAHTTSIIALEWSAPYVHSYTLYRSTDNVTYSSVYTGSNTSYVDTTVDLTANTYYYKVTQTYQGVESSASNIASFSIPNISSLDFSIVLMKTPDKTVTVTGTGFQTNSTIYLGTSSSAPKLDTTYNSDTEVTFVLPASEMAQVGTITVTVFNGEYIKGTSSTITVTDQGNIILLSGTSGIVRSIDGGATWTSVFSSQGVIKIAHSPTLDMLVATVSDQTQKKMLYSQDSGLTWQSTALDQLAFVSPLWLEDFSYFLVCSSSPGRLYKSTDGINWSSVSPTGLGAGAGIMVWSETFDRLFLSAGGVFGDSYYSTDGGETWTLFIEDYGLPQYAESATTGYWAKAAGGANSGVFLKTTNGTSASEQSNDINLGTSGIAYSPTLDTFVATSTFGTPSGHTWDISTDGGGDWTGIDSPADSENWGFIYWSEGIPTYQGEADAKFMAPLVVSGDTRLYVSTTGAEDTWSVHSTADGSYDKGLLEFEGTIVT